MPGAEKTEISVEDVEREIASGSRRLVFTPQIEGVFERDSAPRRARLFIISGIAACILYDIFLAADFMTLHDMFPFMVAVRLGIFTPIILLGIFFVHRNPNGIGRETSGAIISILGVFLPMVAMIFSESPYRLSYQYGSLLVMLFGAVVQQLRFRFAIVSLGCMLAIQLSTTYLSRAFDAETYMGIVLFFVTASVLLVLTTYFLEKAERRSFLFSLRGELLLEQIEFSARTDALTGLYNRRHLAKMSEEIWKAAIIKPRIVSAILLDIDHFKVFNDSRGHMEGDVCLRTVSDCITAVARHRHGLAFRFGGEEMIVLLPGVEAAEAVRTAEDIRAAIATAAIPHPAIGGVVTTSFGVASVVAPEVAAGDLIKAADAALYAAKRDGRDRVTLHAAQPLPTLRVLEASAA